MECLTRRWGVSTVQLACMIIMYALLAIYMSTLLTRTVGLIRLSCVRQVNDKCSAKLKSKKSSVSGVVRCWEDSTSTKYMNCPLCQDGVAARRSLMQETGHVTGLLRQHGTPPMADEARKDYWLRLAHFSNAGAPPPRPPAAAPIRHISAGDHERVSSGRT
jgi:hypothetical protein